MGQSSFYSRKVSFPTIPWMEAIDAENWPKNELGQILYRARNSDISRNVIYDNYYWVDANKNHLPFFTNEIQIGQNPPIEDAGPLGPFVYLDSITGAIYSWEITTNSWVIVTGGSLNIYNSNGTLTGNRNVNGGGFNLSFDNLTKISFDGVVKINDLPLTNNSNISLLTRNDITGEIEIKELSSLPTSNDIEFQNQGLLFGNLSDFQYLNVEGDLVQFTDQGSGVARIKVNAQNITGTSSSTSYLLNIDYGTSAVIPLATTVISGLMSPGDKIKFNFITVTQNVDLDFIEAALVNLNILTGISAVQFDLGTFTGTTISDNVSIKTALQQLETAVENRQVKLQWQDEGVNQGTLGGISTINITGSGATATALGSVLTIDITGGGGGSHQSLIQWQDEGVNLGATGTVTSVDFEGNLIKATRTLNKITVRTPNLGEYFVLPSLDPSNTLSLKVGALVTNIAEATASGRIVDVSLSGFNDAWNPATGLGKSSLILFKATAPAIWTSLLGGEEGKWVRILNISNTLLLLENNSTSGTASAGFINGNGKAVPILTNQSIDLVYTNSKWYMVNLPTYDSFDDFIGIPTGIGSGTWLTANHALVSAVGGNWAVGLNGNRHGIATAEATANRASIGESTSNKLVPNAVGLFYFDRFNIATTANINQRYSRGINRASAVNTNWTAAAGASAIEGGSLVYFPDSGLVNATTNWFYYVGTGVLADYTANAVDSGITVASTVANPQNLIVYYNGTNFDFTFITSDNNRDYTIRTTINRGVPSGTNTASLIHNRVSGSGGIPGLDWLYIHTPTKINR